MSNNLFEMVALTAAFPNDSTPMIRPKGSESIEIHPAISDKVVIKN